MNKSIKVILYILAVLTFAFILVSYCTGCAAVRHTVGGWLVPETNAVTGVVTHVPSTNAVQALEGTRAVVNTFAPGLGHVVYAVGAGILGIIGTIYGSKTRKK